MRKYYAIAILTLAFCTFPVQAKDKLKLDTTIIKGNKEMPQIVYIVPWKDFKQKQQKEQTLVLHSLFGDLYDPIRELSSDNKP